MFQSSSSLINTFTILPDPRQAATFILENGILIYPTETFYALGCAYNNYEAIRAIYDMKRRPLNKPFPLIAADLDNALQLVIINQFSENLVYHFWPGPLTVILNARASVPPLLCNKKKKCAIRITANTETGKMVKFCNQPLIATSANLSGEKPASSILELSCSFLLQLRKANMVIGIAAWPYIPVFNPLPSTIVEPVAKNRVILHRKGAISRKELEKSGFSVMRDLTH